MSSLAPAGVLVPADTSASEIDLEIKRSHFLGLAARTTSEAQAREFIASRRALYPDARHHCSAFIIANPGATPTERSNDDGEPSGTAGKPMLEVLRGSQIFDVTVVVTRYFGGTLLGTGGLVRAYSQATAQALEQLSLCRRSQQYLWQLRAPVAEAGRIEAELRAGGANIVQTRWESQATIELASAVANPTELAALVANVTRGQGQLEAAGTKILELPL
ncbi:MAG: YigZ family protein [Actinomyces graevenitzii]|jgi:hypothetical protein cresD4_04625|uniref:Impact N-terminal domain-containing protein n=2 Tax=Actinomyces graevenitzii TaxID=55565 RepID=G9PEI9_9ACTO|nr:YigZ family protein [Actinomyces graevenitzii]EHM88865.1 hypothetical protein HMPREF0045_00663 [Actinomyces graevenitzii C83]MBS6933864.1 YigZ family protein [Actinomyces graevenitzii]